MKPDTSFGRYVKTKQILIVFQLTILMQSKPVINAKFSTHFSPGLLFVDLLIKDETTSLNCFQTIKNENRIP